jgi:hypothetical protein
MRRDIYGKPCVGAHYERFDAHSHRLDPMARCCICGRMATNVHHWPPLGIGGGGRQMTHATPVGRFVLLPALFAVCGGGNASGCHGAWHAGLVDVEWLWDDPASQDAWEDGTLLKRSKPGRWLYGLGRYRFADARTGRTWEHREDAR